MDQAEFYKQLAEHEIGWWKAHHKKDEPLLTEHMAKLYKLQFNIPYEDALKAVKYRVDATKEHDIAEKLEDEGNQPGANCHWKKAEDLLLKHFKILLEYSKRPEN